MKALLALVFLVFATSLCSVNLINESFASQSIPTGWTATGPSPAAWMINSTNYAGGAANELRLHYTPSATGNYHFISPAIDTRTVYDMSLSFRHALDDYAGTSTSYTIGVQISHDLINWATVWSVNTSTSITATPVSVDIPYSYGMHQTTYLAFWFSGNNYEINRWCIDNIVLDYTDTLGSGTWPAGSYNPVGELYVPAGHTFILSAGTQLNFEYGRSLNVQGSLKALGQFGLPVVFSGVGSSTWGGIKLLSTGSAQDSTIIDYALIENSNDSALLVSYSNKVRMSNSLIRSNSAYYLWSVIILDNTNAIIENCDISENISETPVLWAYYGSPIIRNNSFDQNLLPYNNACVRLEYISLDNFTGNSITRNQRFDGNGLALMLLNCRGTLYRQKIANNIGDGILISGTASVPNITNCLVVNNWGVGLVVGGWVDLRSTIVWGNELGSIENFQTNLSVRYSCIQGGSGGISGTSIPGENYTDNISDNPLFVNPSFNSMDMGDPSLYDWLLHLASPCIDAGDPSHPVDADGSIVDIGMYSRKLKPFISRAADLPADQGHQLDLKWLPNELDTQYQPDWYYTVWREGSTRDDAIQIGSLAELGTALAAKAENICWRDGTRTWYYLAQVPVMGFADYGLIVPTLQDSSSTGTHAANYMVVYHNTSNSWMSVPQSGYSVDNIPPMPVRALDLQHLSSTTYALAWDEVTEGIWEGNSYPEINQVRYKVYASQDPSVPIMPQNLIGITSSPQILINSSSDRRFFRVVAFD